MPKPIWKSGFVAIVGRPNVGKSTLLNRLVGERLAAVSAKAQTTRRRFRGIRSEAEGAVHYQMVFVDTPGIHVPAETKLLNQFCVEEAVDAIADADVYVYVVDASREYLAEAPGSDEALVLKTLRGAIAASRNASLIVVINKIDLAGGEDSGTVRAIANSVAALNPSAVLLATADKGKGVPELLTRIRERLPEHPPYYATDIVSDETMRVIAAEQIQEQIYRRLGEEIPYECAVEIESYKEPAGAKKKTEIAAVIHVERPTQKQIVIGSGGGKIKEIGQAARANLEKLIGGGVVLKLFVRENPGWTRDKKRLARLGYALPKASDSGQEGRP